jgi:microcystin-dependent protein
MSSPFVAEIRIFAGNFAPRGWALCDGQILAISQNTALFSLLGTQYGGDGKSNFALPNFQGCAAIHQGQGPGLTDRLIGESAGEPAVTLLTSEMPVHSHTAMCQSAPGLQAAPTNNVWSGLPGRPTPPPIYSTAAPDVDMSPQALAVSGGSQPHNNMSPYQCLTFIIALQGVFPARN